MKTLFIFLIINCLCISNLVTQAQNNVLKDSCEFEDNRMDLLDPKSYLNNLSSIDSIDSQIIKTLMLDNDTFDLRHDRLSFEDEIFQISDDINIYQDIDRFVNEFDTLIRKELETVENLLLNGKYSILNDMIKQNKFNFLLRNYWYDTRNPIKPMDTLYIIYKPISQYITDPDDYAIMINYLKTKLSHSNIQDTNYIIYLGLSIFDIDIPDNERFKVFPVIFSEFPELQKNHKIYFDGKHGYAREVYPLPDFKDDKERYSKYLLDLIEILLTDFIQEIQFQDYTSLEEDMEPLSLSQKIMIRYKFLSHYYENFKEEYSN